MREMEGVGGIKLTWFWPAVTGSKRKWYFSRWPSDYFGKLGMYQKHDLGPHPTKMKSCLKCLFGSILQDWEMESYESLTHGLNLIP